MNASGSWDPLFPPCYKQIIGKKIAMLGFNSKHIAWGTTYSLSNARRKTTNNKFIHKKKVNFGSVKYIKAFTRCSCLEKKWLCDSVYWFLYVTKYWSYNDPCTNDFRILFHLYLHIYSRTDWKVYVLHLFYLFSFLQSFLILTCDSCIMAWLIKDKKTDKSY